MARSFGEFHDRIDVITKTHLEHFIGLIEHQGLHLLKVDGLAADQIHQATGCGHQHLRWAFERLDLNINLVSAAYDIRKNAVGIFSKFKQLFLHLLGQLARRRQHHHLNLWFFRIYRCQQRQPKGCGFPGSGLGLPDKVRRFPQQHRNGSSLDFGRGLDAQFFESFEIAVGNAEIFKCVHNHSVLTDVFTGKGATCPEAGKETSL